MYRILSIDGGGARGLVPARILAHIEQRLIEESGDEDQRLADFFDFIAGTSVGGILSLIYLAPPGPSGRRYSAAEISTQLAKMLPGVFSVDLWQKINSIWGLGGNKYDPRRLETWMRFFFHRERLSAVKTPCLITAYDFRSQQPLYFRSHLARADELSDFSLFDVARATSAAPSYFAPHEMSDIKGENSYFCSDGILFAYSPALAAYAEARRLIPELNAAQMNILSLGTGHRRGSHDVADINEWGGLHWGVTIGKLMADCSALNVNEQLRQVFHDSQENYTRINPELDDDCSLDMDCVTPENIEALVNVAEAYIKDNHGEIEGVVNALLAGHRAGDEPDEQPLMQISTRPPIVVNDWRSTISAYHADIELAPSQTALANKLISLDYSTLADWLQRLSSGFSRRLGLTAGSQAVVAIDDELLLSVVGRALAEIGVVCRFSPGGLRMTELAVEINRGARVVFVDSREIGAKVAGVFRNLAVIWADPREFHSEAPDDMMAEKPITSLLMSLGSLLKRGQQSKPDGYIRFNDFLTMSPRNVNAALQPSDHILIDPHSALAYSHQNLVAAASQMGELMAGYDVGEQPLFAVALSPSSHSAIVLTMFLGPRLGASVVFFRGGLEGFEEVCARHPERACCLFARTEWFESRLLKRQGRLKAGNIALALAFGNVYSSSIASQWAELAGSELVCGWILGEDGPLVGAVAKPADAPAIVEPVRATELLPAGEPDDNGDTAILARGPQLSEWHWHQGFNRARNDWQHCSEAGRLDGDGRLLLE